MNTNIIALHDEDVSRDLIIIAMVNDDGMTINKATKEYAKVAKKEGWTTALVSHKDAALEYLAEEYDDNWTPATVASAVVDLVDRYKVAESTARDYCKAYSKELKVDHPVADPREAIFDWFIANPNPLKDEFIEYATDTLGRSRSNANEYWKGFELHIALLAASHKA